MKYEYVDKEGSKIILNFDAPGYLIARTDCGERIYPDDGYSDIIHDLVTRIKELEARLKPHKAGRADTQAMAEAAYQKQCEFMGPDHEGHCVEILKLAFDSQEDRIQALEDDRAEPDPNPLHEKLAARLEKQANLIGSSVTNYELYTDLADILRSKP